MIQTDSPLKKRPEIREQKVNRSDSLSLLLDCFLFYLLLKPTMNFGVSCRKSMFPFIYFLANLNAITGVIYNIVITIYSLAHTHL